MTSLCLMIFSCVYFYTEQMAPISEEIKVKDEPWMESSEYDQIADDEDDSKIEKVWVTDCPEVYPWQTIKTENEEMTAASDIDIKDEPLLPSADDNEGNYTDPKTTQSP